MNLKNLISEINSESEPKTHTIFIYRVEEPEIDDGFDILDCIFIRLKQFYSIYYSLKPCFFYLT